MKLKYALDRNVFSDDSAFENAIRQVKEGNITTDDVVFVMNRRIMSLYKALKAIFPYDKDYNSIWKREVVIDFISKLSHPELSLNHFQVLIENGIVSVCGSGYLFDYEIEEDKAEDISRYVDIVFLNSLYL